jgi:hypothetical protein
MGKKVLYISLFVCIALLFLRVLTWKGATIYKTAYLSKHGSNFIITIRGRGVGHPAGLGDIIFPHTFPDSEQYVIPRDTGVIKGEELPYDSCCYKSTGIIIITGNQIKVSLYFKNTDDKRLDAGTWNGNYDLLRLK